MSHQNNVHFLVFLVVVDIVKFKILSVDIVVQLHSFLDEESS
jgi:hypothetical protein